jgi:hypothetical protein
MKNGSCFGTVRFALIRKNSVKTAKREHLIRGRVRAFKQKSRKTVKKVRYAARSSDKFGAPSVHPSVKCEFLIPKKFIKITVLQIVPRVGRPEEVLFLRIIFDLKYAVFRYQKNKKFYLYLIDKYNSCGCEI